MLSETFQEACAHYLAVASRLFSHWPVGKTTELRHNPCLLQPRDEIVDEGNSTLWLDLDWNVQYSGNTSWSPRSSIPLGTTVATCVGLNLHRHLAPPSIRYIPFFVIPASLILTQAREDCGNSCSVLSYATYQRSPSPDNLLPNPPTPDESLSPPPHRSHVQLWNSPFLHRVPPSPRPATLSIQQTPQNVAEPIASTFSMTDGSAPATAFPMLPSMQNTRLLPVPQANQAFFGSSNTPPTQCLLPSLSPSPGRSRHNNMWPVTPRTSPQRDPTSIWTRPSADVVPNAFQVPADVNVNLRFELKQDPNPPADSAAFPDVVGNLAVAPGAWGFPLRPLGERPPAYQNPSPNIRPSPMPGARDWEYPQPLRSAGTAMWTPTSGTYGSPLESPAPAINPIDAAAPHRRQEVRNSLWLDARRGLGPLNDIWAPSGQHNDHGRATHFALPDDYLPPPPGLPSLPRTYALAPAPPSYAPSPVQPELPRAREPDVFAPWNQARGEPFGHAEHHVRNTLDAPFGPPPGLGPPRPAFDAIHGRIPPRPPSPMVSVKFGLRSDDDEIVVPNRKQQQVQLPGPIGGVRDEPEPVVPMPVELPLVPLSLDAYGQPVWTETRPWHVESLSYAGSGKKRPILKRNGFVFDVVGEIVHGGAGRVVAVKQRGDLYAVKTMHKWRAQKMYGYPRSALIEEKDAMTRIADAKASYLAKLLMSWEDQNNIFFVMPFYPMDMAQRLDLPITEHDKLLYCAELVAGLQNLCALNIIHRDIKPANILIDSQGRALISDFGLSRIALPPQTYDTWSSFGPVGTGPYMAPELVAPEYSAFGHGAKLDVFSLGVVFLLLFGLGDRWCFLPHMTCEQLCAMHSHRLPIDPASLAHVNATAAALIPLMLQKSPTERVAADVLHRYIPDFYWKQVVAEIQHHDWFPGRPSVPLIPVGRSLEFLTFRQDPAHNDARDDTWMQAALSFRRDEENAKPTDFEYRDSEVFRDAL